MAAPSTYTEETLALFMDATLGTIADSLGWSVAGGDYEEAVNSALLAYGTDDISTITGLANIRALRALAKVAVWRAVVEATSGDYDFRADGGDYKRSQAHAQALDALALAEAEAAPYSPSYRVDVVSVDYAHDPYQSPRAEDVE